MRFRGDDCTMGLCDYCCESQSIVFNDLETYGNLCDSCCESLEKGEYYAEND